MGSDGKMTTAEELLKKYSQEVTPEQEIKFFKEQFGKPFRSPTAEGESTGDTAKP